MRRSHTHWLQPVFPHKWLSLSPGGGEAYGDLLIAALPRELLPDVDAATVALFKLTLCLSEEWPYEAWDEAFLQQLHPAFLAELQTWNLSDHHQGVPRESESLRNLHAAAEGVVKAQRTLTRPLNPWRGGPTVEASGALARLEFMQSACLRRQLRDEWNDCAALFEDEGAWVFAGWGTNA